MKDFKHDDERLAALLAGRLDGPEREELLAHLLSDEEDYQVFADAAAILQEAEAEEAAHAQFEQEREPVQHPPVREAVPPSARGGWRRWKAPRVIIAPVLAGLAVLVTLVGRVGGAVPGPMRLAGDLARPESGFPAGWEAPVIDGARGDGTSGERQRSVRAGVMLMDLGIAARAGDAEATRRLAAALKGDFALQGGAALDSVQARAGQPYTALEPSLRTVTERLEGSLDAGFLRLGAWAEAVRVAALRGDAAFFRSGDTRAALRRAGRLTRDDPTARDALSRLRAAIDASDWPAVETQAEALIGAMGR